MSSIAVETREVWSVFALVRIIQIDVKVDGPISIECLAFSFECSVLSVSLKTISIGVSNVRHDVDVILFVLCTT